MNNFIIKIEDIEKSANKTLEINFEDFIEGIKSNEPIKAELDAVSLGEFIQIRGHVKGSALLQCDLCLEEFEYELDFEIEELYAKTVLINEDAETKVSKLEIELKDGQFVTDLNGTDSIDIQDLLYQSVILDFPNKKVCGIKCKGNKFLSEDNFAQSEADPRLAVFKTINTKENKPTQKK
jgi:uncharacterized protein